MKQAAIRDLTLNFDICSSETSIDGRRTTQRYILEERTLRNCRCENLKSDRFSLGGGRCGH
jgi:hypothetical protein